MLHLNNDKLCENLHRKSSNFAKKNAKNMAKKAKNQFSVFCPPLLPKNEKLEKGEKTKNSRSSGSHR